MVINRSKDGRKQEIKEYLNNTYDVNTTTGEVKENPR